MLVLSSVCDRSIAINYTRIRDVEKELRELQMQVGQQTGYSHYHAAGRKIKHQHPSLTSEEHQQLNKADAVADRILSCQTQLMQPVLITGRVLRCDKCCAVTCCAVTCCALGLHVS